jgi:hypothetical protein
MSLHIVARAEFTHCREGRAYVFQYCNRGIVLGFEKNIYPCTKMKHGELITTSALAAVYLLLFSLFFLSSFPSGSK